MLELLNACFPFHTTPEQYQLAQQDWHLQYCLFEASRQLGWLGVRGSRGWLCYIAVAPHLRGQGRAGQLCQQLIEHAKDLGLGSLQLEVRTAEVDEERLPAERVYSKLGFQRGRKLSLWQGPGGPPAGSLANARWGDCRERWWQTRDSLARWPWQRELESLVDPLECYQDEQCCLVFARSGSILHIFGRPQVKLPSGWRMNNLLEGEACLDYLVAQQGQIYGHQWEMELTLS